VGEGKAMADDDRKDTKKIAHGYFSWYADLYDPNVHITLPQGLVLISRDPLYDFEIRRHGGNVYYVSEYFLGLLKRFNASFSDCAPISVCSQDGKSISRKQYYAILFNRIRITDVASMDHSIFEVNEFERIMRIKKLTIKNDFTQYFSFSLKHEVIMTRRCAQGIFIRRPWTLM
jgi:hypothetical protein